ncbi:Nitrogen fixation protein FixH [Roseivivax lentus]|uniref:Nitrogen fixation protein FixH n=1 Tax=Roseivivax lentus TaxID=633194 RepID=A0A1N7MQV3_9RHOB|nr:FixH family protein [Roseivivax lentus]SIS88503.1 Nitrogen fixation protein FixH [Roseivivax lentus]
MTAPAKPLTGRKVFAIFAAGFSIIIAVNLTLAVNAVRTFPGLEVENSYVASQVFDSRRDAQEALGWQIDAAYADGALRIDMTDRVGNPVAPGDLTVRVGRPTMEAQDLDGRAALGRALPLDLAPGRWRVDVAATAPDGTPVEKRILLWVRS